jgi:DNA-binding NtrC family response regulator
MSQKVLIVEDQFLEARSLSIMLRNAGHLVEGVAKCVDQALEFMDKNSPDVVLLDIFLQGPRNGIDLARILDSRNIPFIYLSANSNTSILEQAIATKPCGFLVKPFRERDILIALDIAVYRFQKNREFALRQRSWLVSLLRNMLQTEGAQIERLIGLIRALTSFLPFDLVVIDLGPDAAAFCFQRIGFDEYVQLQEEETIHFSDAEKQQQPYFQNGGSLPEVGMAIHKTRRPRSKLWMPAGRRRKPEKALAFYSCGDEQYTHDHLDLLVSVEEELLPVLELIRGASAKTGPNMQPLVKKAPNQLLKPRIEGVIGKSPKLLEALDKVTQVAPFDNTVLILGETGVGKEGLVKLIHQLSARKSKPLIKINCAAIPVNLVESELFGHEKGAFTGALERRIGKFEQANGGTLFLDEIGELPLEVQSKLLRALQEKEIERVGGRTTIRTDVRIITATNRDLPREIGEGRFRLDLYYRINVFPIQLPPLRQRLEDIPALAAYFLQMYGAQMHLENIIISPAAMRQLQEYAWPGNIRELQHLLERHVLGCRSGVIETFEMPAPIPMGPAYMPIEPEIMPFADMDKYHILQALKKSNGKISGKGGAAELLRLPPTTLSSKMKRLGIKWPPQPI